MIIMKEPKLLFETFADGIERSKRYKKPILISITTSIDKQNALAIFSAYKNKTDMRTFWTEPSREFTLIGIGTEMALEAEGLNRFKDIDRKWQQMLEHAIIANEAMCIGTGPTIIGGFNFDPLKEKSALWKSFPDAKLVLPKYMLTAYQENHYLTENYIVTQKDEPETLMQKAEMEKENLFVIPETFDDDAPSSIIKEEIEPQTWIQTVERTTEQIKKQELEKVVLAREMRLYADVPFSPEHTLKHLLKEQTTSFVFAFEYGQDCFLGATPERLAKRVNDEVLFTCLAGSIKRGKTDDEDERLGNFLLNDQKNRYEHKLVVDMISHVANKMCKNVHVPEQPILLKTPHVQHLYTPITAKTGNASLLEIIEAMHPTPALGGYPKETGIEKIRNIERIDRGWYAAPIGWIDYNGNGEFAAAIRSALLQEKQASLFAGVGLVADSDPMAEYEETLIKFKPMLSALGVENHD